jgi:hypothetical protein
MWFGQDASGACQYPRKTQLWLEAYHRTVHVSIFGMHETEVWIPSTIYLWLSSGSHIGPLSRHDSTIDPTYL